MQRYTNKEVKDDLQDKEAIKCYNETFWYYMDTLPERIINDSTILWIRKSALKGAGL